MSNHSTAIKASEMYIVSRDDPAWIAKAGLALLRLVAEDRQNPLRLNIDDFVTIVDYIDALGAGQPRDQLMVLRTAILTKFRQLALYSTLSTGKSINEGDLADLKNYAKSPPTVLKKTVVVQELNTILAQNLATISAYIKEHDDMEYSNVLRGLFNMALYVHDHEVKNPGLVWETMRLIASKLKYSEECKSLSPILPPVQGQVLVATPTSSASWTTTPRSTPATVSASTLTTTAPTTASTATLTTPTAPIAQAQGPPCGDKPDPAQYEKDVEMYFHMVENTQDFMRKSIYALSTKFGSEHFPSSWDILRVPGMEYMMDSQTIGTILNHFHKLCRSFDTAESFTVLEEFLSPLSVSDREKLYKLYQATA